MVLMGFEGLISLDTIDRGENADRSGASPWERMQGAAMEGTILTFCAISVRVTTEVYERFYARCEQEPALKEYIEGVLLNACSHT